MTPPTTPERRSIDVEGFSHRNPIPAASQIGPLLVSSIVIGYNPGTSEVPVAVTDQVRNLFGHIGAILAEGGADWSDIVRMTFYVPQLEMRPEINAVWATYFPDEASRPARITHEMPTELGVRCEFLAYVSTRDGSDRC